MNLSQLSMFRTVAELGSLRLASEQLHKTQPAISQGLRQLESSLALTLFDRAGYRLALTDAGTILYQHAVRALDEVNTFKEVAAHFSAGNETSVSVAIEASFDLQNIVPLLEDVQNRFPATQIVLKQEYVSGAIESLKSGDATLCISAVNVVAELDPNFEFHFLNSGLLLDVASPRLLARYPNLSLGRELLNEYQIVVQDSGGGTGDRDLGVQDGQRRWYVNDFGTKKMLIESGMGWGKIPYYHAQPSLENGQLVALEFSDTTNQINMRYHVIKVKDQLLGPVAQALWDQFKEGVFKEGEFKESQFQATTYPSAPLQD